MAVYAVLAAEVLMLVWFVLFGLLAHGLVVESRDLPAAKADTATRRLTGSARLAFAVGLSILAALNLYQWFGG